MTQTFSSESRFSLIFRFSKGPPEDQVPKLRDSLTFRFSLSLAASFGWLNRNMFVLPSRITAPGRQHNKHQQQKVKSVQDRSLVPLWRLNMFSLYFHSENNLKEVTSSLTLVELRRLRHLNSIN